MQNTNDNNNSNNNINYNGYVVRLGTDMSHNLIISKSIVDFDFAFDERIPRVWYKLTPRGQIEFHVHEFQAYITK